MKRETRHGKRAAGKTQTSISMREDVLEAAKRQAESEGRTLSNWIEQLLKERFPEVPTPRPTSSKRGKS